MEVIGKLTVKMSFIKKKKILSFVVVSRLLPEVFKSKLNNSIAFLAEEVKDNIHF